MTPPADLPLGLADKLFLRVDRPEDGVGVHDDGVGREARDIALPEGGP